nr:reverse transcriptase domain-containing protein [Tanacetum cinerariifolium]
MLRACPHHGFTKLTQIDTFYNGLNENDQDSLNAAAGGNLLSKTTREVLHIIVNKSKVRCLRNKPNVSRMNTTSRENASKLHDRIDKLADQISTLVDIFSKKVVTPATVKAVEESCVTCGGNHAYYYCDATNSNQSSVCTATGTYNQVAPQNRASNFMAPPGFTPGDICLIEKLLNDDPFQLLPMNLKQGEVVKEKSSIEEPPGLELKDLPSHLEYAYLEVWVNHRLATAYHPQTSGQVEVSNRGLKRILERTVDENRASWSEKLKDALWAFRTGYKTPIGCTPYKLVYRKSCHLPIELEHKAYWALKHVNFDLKTAGDHQKLQLNELHDQAYENSLIYKEKKKSLYESKIKNHIFDVGGRVVLFNSRLKIFSIKLKTRWSGPFTITKVFPYGTVELSQPEGLNFKVNGHRLKHYFGGDIP